MKLIQILLFLSATVVYAQEKDTLYVLQTTDVHGTIYPYDYFADEPANDRGLAKIYTLVKKYRLRHKNVLLVDSGDLLQGTALTDYFNRNESEKPHPMILAMNYMGYDAFAVGNHDIEQGLFTYRRAQRDADFPFLSANAIMPDGRTFFPAYTILKRGEIRIALFGLTTPGIPMWLDENLYPGIRWADMLETARPYANKLDAEADLLLGLFHAGFNAGYSSAQTDAAGLPNENASGIIAEQLPQFDAVFAGHSHRAEPMPAGRKNAKSFSNDVLRLNAGAHGRNLAIAEFVFSRSSEGLQLVSKKAWLESVEDVEAAPEILLLTKYYHDKTLEYIRSPLAQSEVAFDAGKARFEDSAIIDLVQAAQLDYSGADISFAACFNTRFKRDKGAFRVKDLYAVYPYENKLYTLTMSGSQVKAFLEYSARFYVWQNDSLKKNPDMAGYNYDMAEGVSYTIDVSKAPGERIKNLRLTKTAKPLLPEELYKVALNSYRASGGGGHMQAAGAENTAVLHKSELGVREILKEYIARRDTLRQQATHNWKLTH